MTALPVRPRYFTAWLVVLLLTSLVMLGWCAKRIKELNKDRLRLIEEVKRTDDSQNTMLLGLPGIESASHRSFIQERGLWAPRSISF